MMWNFFKKKPEPSLSPVEEFEAEMYLVDFDDLTDKVKLLSPKAQVALMYRLIGVLHPQVLDTTKHYINRKQERHAENSKFRQKAHHPRVSHAGKGKGNA